MPYNDKPVIVAGRYTQWLHGICQYIVNNGGSLWWGISSLRTEEIICTNESTLLRNLNPDLMGEVGDSVPRH